MRRGPKRTAGLFSFGAAMETHNGNVKIRPSILIQLLAWLVAVVLAYGVVTARVSVLEDRVDSLKTDVREIKQDLKELLRMAK
jgi:hypothetical protein